MQVDEIRALGKCCACGGSLLSSEGVNLVALPKRAKWKHPTSGNVLSGESGLAIALLCDACVNSDMSPLRAVEFRDGDGGKVIHYHDIRELQDAEAEENANA